MKITRWFVVALLLMMITAVPVQSATAPSIFEWDGPTTYVNGDPLNPLTDIWYYTVYWGPVQAAGTAYPNKMMVSNSTTNYSINIGINETMWAIVTATTITAKGGLTSAPSVAVSKTIPATEPTACTGRWRN